MSDPESAELDRLRGRAYGPDPDIDAAGAARLAELEARRREPDRAPEPQPADTPSAAVDPAPSPTEEAPPGERHTRVGSAARWALPAFALGALVAAGVTVALSTTTGPDGRPFRAATGTTTLPVVTSKAFPVEWAPHDARVHGWFAGLDVRSWRLDDTQECLGVASPDGMGLVVDVTCTPALLDPIIDVYVGEDTGDPYYPYTPDRMGGIPNGTIVRLQLVADEVVVTVAEPPPQR